MKQGMTITELTQEIDRQAASKLDFVADTAKLNMEILPAEGSNFDPTRLVVAEGPPEITTPWPVTGLAHRQIAERVGIPWTYYERMLGDAGARFLLADNVNHWFESRPEPRMVRTLDGQARAFLSNRYQRIDNIEVMQTVGPVIEEANRRGELWSVASANVEATSFLHLKLINQTVSRSITTIKGVDDRVHAGLVVKNSEVGMGAFSVEPLIFWLVCTNGMISTKMGTRKAHLGRRIEGEEASFLLLSDEAKAADDHAYLLKVRDIVTNFLKEDTFEAIIRQIEAGTTREITGKIEKAVEVLGQTIGLHQTELEPTLRHFIDGAQTYGLTQYGLLNAVTRMSQDVDNYDRATEIEAAASAIPAMSLDSWRSISEAA